MRNCYLLALVCTISAAPLFSQQPLQEPDTSKYRIDLPDYWSPQSLAVSVLTDVLPRVCPELSDKKVCGDCNPGLTVELYVTEPAWVANTVTKPNNNVNRRRRPKSNQIFVEQDLVYPVLSSKVTVPRTQVVSSSWEISTYYSFQCFLLLKDREQKIITRLILVDSNEVWKINNLQNEDKAKNKPDTPPLNADQNTILPKPGSAELLAIADKKILALGKRSSK